MRARARSIATQPDARALAAGALGANLRTVSAMARTPRSLSVPLADHLPQVFLHGAELADQPFDRRLVDAGEDLRHEALAQREQAVEQRPRRRGEEQALGAAVMRIGAALDHVAVAQPVDQPRQGDGLEVEHLGELVLLEPLAALQADQHRPLGARHPVLARQLVDIGPHQAGYIADKKSEFTRGAARSHVW